MNRFEKKIKKNKLHKFMKKKYNKSEFACLRSLTLTPSGVTDIAMSQTLQGLKTSSKILKSILNLSGNK